MKNAILSIGSNLGNRIEFLKSSIKNIRLLANTTITNVSDVYETEPIGVSKQSNYLNCIVYLKTDLSPYDLLTEINEIEKMYKRERRIKWGPRTLDIDIIDYDNKIVNTEQLTLPHPRMHKRRFVLLPMTEIKPDYIHPLYKISLFTMLKKTEKQKCVKMNMENWYNE